MASRGIRDRVAIVGMGCTNFGERWDKSSDDLLIDASRRRSSRGDELDDVDAFWARHHGLGRQSGLTLSRPLKIDYKPVTRVENFCATGSEAFRNACYAVASGAYDVVMAIVFEKLKDSGYSGTLRSAAPPPTARLDPHGTRFVLASRGPLYTEKYGVTPEEMEEVMTRIAWKNHHNGARNPRAPVPQGGLEERSRPLPSSPASSASSTARA